jgi:signal transduction histidine kinase
MREELERLNEAFESFNRASDILSSYFEALKEQVRDLSEELRRKNEELERTLSFLNSVLEGIGEGMIVIDRKEEVLFINQTASWLTGRAADETVGRDLNSLGLEWIREKNEMQLNLNGESRSIEVNISDVKSGGDEAIGKVVLLRDVTRNRELEAERQRNRRLIAMGEMMASIVHELRNPLCSIELYASMLYRELAGTDLSSLAEGVSTGVQNLNNFLTNMLYFAKPRKPRMTDFSLDGLLNDALRMVEPVLASRGITLIREHSTRILRADRGLLLQVLMNLLLNAIQAMEAGGELTITEEVEGDTLHLSITDTGCGISEPDMERIFDPFFTRREGGTGLGLPIALKIMQAHGGSIRIRSRQGDGSTFTLVLPLNGSSDSRGFMLMPPAAEEEVVV